MNCLCCGKPLQPAEEASGWHRRCIKKFFGTETLPRIKLNGEVLARLTAETTGRGYTVPGVQKKLPLHLEKERGGSRLTLVNFPTGYILKPQVEHFRALPEAEQLVMQMADASHIFTVPHALIRGENGYSYITRRIDRVFHKDGTELLAMEDFCQLDLRLTQDKYRSSYERCAKVIDRYSCRSQLDLTEMYLRLVFSFLIGNSDMHLKNFSLIEMVPGSGRYTLSPAYDLLPVNVIMPEDSEELALSLNGKKAHLRRKDFLLFSRRCGIDRLAAEKMMDRLLGQREQYLAMCRDSLLPQDMKEQLAELIRERTERLTK